MSRAFLRLFGLSSGTRQHERFVGWRMWLFMALIAAWLVPAALSGPAVAQTPIEVNDTSVRVDYPAAFNFRLRAQSNADITKLAIRYRLERTTCVASITNEAWPEFNPAPRVDTTWTWQMKKTGGLPPGARLQYSWLIVNAKGQRLETPWASAIFEDSRFAWKNVSDGQITLYWYEGDQKFANSLLSAGSDALKRVAPGARLERPAKIYIYASTDALQSARVFAPTWEGGVAFPDYGIIAIGVPTSQLDWGQKTVAHELAHVLTFQQTRNCYGQPPTWANEGRSVYAEGELEASQQRRLEQAIARNTLFSARTLSGPFPASPDQALLSYAESYSMVRHLITKYGNDKFMAFLAGFKEGLTDDEAMTKVYGLDTDTFDAQWRASVGAPPRPAAAPGRASAPQPVAPRSAPIPQPAGPALTPAMTAGPAIGIPGWPGVAAALGAVASGVSVFGWTRRGRR
ncbi:MAG: peptidase MA domain-containing protein [Chloroflexi bacterium]|nr:peptidase MA domain-containing protein [Chloroflexota bacterium]